MRPPVLLVIDPQRIFADPASDWASPFFGAAMTKIEGLAAAIGPERTLVTRWLPTADRSTAWGDYFRAWPFADVDPADALYELVDPARGLSGHPTIDEPTFGKWGPQLERAITGATGGPAAETELIVTGVSTDCCVIATVLAAADAGMHVTVVSDACAPSTEADGAATMQVMGLFGPQVRIRAQADVLAELAASA